MQHARPDRVPMPNDKPNKDDKPEAPKREGGADDAKVESKRKELSEKLTPEEQMALYEKELKENDWGHQPC
jgi:hypothetical protein